MNSIQISNQDSSSISHSATGSFEGRYKKALKEISKLVAVNMSLKKQVEHWKQNYEKLEYMYQQTVLKYNGMMSKISQKTAQFGSADEQFKLSDFDEFPNNYESKLNKNVFHETASAQLQKSGNSQIQQQLTLKISQLSNQLDKLQLKNNQKEDIINQLHLALEKKHAEIIQLEGRNGDLNQQLIKIKNTPVRIVAKQNSVASSVNEQIMREKRRVRELEEKLQREKDWSKKVQSEYQQMRKSLIMLPQNSSFQYDYNQGNNSMTQFNTNSSTSSFFDRSKSKSKKSQNISGYEVDMLKKEYAEKKGKYKAQISKMKEEINQLNQRITSMNIFIGKQQEYIENFSNPKPLGKF